MILTNGARFRLTRFPPDEADAAALLALAAKRGHGGRTTRLILSGRATPRP